MYRLSHEYEHYFITLIFSETPTPPPRARVKPQEIMCTQLFFKHGWTWFTICMHTSLPFHFAICSHARKEQHANGS